jgi:hypothetical protein
LANAGEVWPGQQGDRCGYLRRFGAWGYESIQNDRDGDLWIVEDVGGNSFGLPDGHGCQSQRPSIII